MPPPKPRPVTVVDVAYRRRVCCAMGQHRLRTADADTRKWVPPGRWVLPGEVYCADCNAVLTHDPAEPAA